MRKRKTPKHHEPVELNATLILTGTEMVSLYSGVPTFDGTNLSRRFKRQYEEKQAFVVSESHISNYLISNVNTLWK